MDDDLAKVKNALAQVAASLQVLAANTQSNTSGIQGLAEELTRVSQDVNRLADETGRRNASTLDEIQTLRGTFASIEQHLVKMFEQRAEDHVTLEDVVKRVEALEQSRPPAA